MTPATQLEVDFVKWLAELSTGVAIRYGRWFETEDGDANGGDYCVECVDAERVAREDPSHEMHEYRFVAGWNDAHETDSTPRCEACGCILEHSLTEYGVEEDIEHLSTLSEIGEYDAAIFHHWLSGIGDYRREKHWPMIKPHAKRLMKAAGVTVIPDDFVTFRPRNIWDNEWFDFDTVWLSIYQYFARKLVSHFGEDAPLEFLNDTSSINNHRFKGFSKESQPRRHVKSLLEHVGRDTNRGRFLAEIGLRCLADMETVITIPDERGARPNYDVRGRIVREQPNSCHAKARVVTSSELVLNSTAELWQYRIYYEFNHWGNSSWHISTSQRNGQRLSEFLNSVPGWIEEVLEPDVRVRSHMLRDWDKKHSAIRELFSVSCDNEVSLATMLGSRRIKLNNSRLAALKLWIEEDLE